MHFFKHLKTINRHKRMVMVHCFKCGLIWQGLLHDLSKYSPTEFINGAKYYAGIHSPHFNERKDKGYSDAWMHHKGRNKHHPEYWTDYNMELKRYAPVKMPDKYLAEMICDRVAASKNYNWGHFTPDIPLNYFISKNDASVMHPETAKATEMLLRMYAEKGEKETFKYIKENLVKKKGKKR
ncbi:MAG: DUF5662 family protein [Lachnospiraceae bacterium]|nr:DUF5662 family protein [Lachnospiraceae bacterium]